MSEKGVTIQQQTASPGQYDKIGSGMFDRNEGVGGRMIAQATGWAPQTVRGFFADLAKKGITVEVVDRVRQVGRNTQGTKGICTVYLPVVSHE
jgi:hypothetical protein